MNTRSNKYPVAKFWAGIVSACVAAACLTVALAEEPQVRKKEGHSAPLKVRLTYTNGETETGMLTGTYGNGFDDAYQLHGTALTGSGLAIWMDTISSIKEINDKDILITSRNGAQRRLVPTTSNLNLKGQDGAAQDVELAKLKSIEFVKAPRKDKLGNAMFPQWRYSPFTGERLPLE